jgi:hypothetical protein
MRTYTKHSGHLDLTVPADRDYSRYRDVLADWIRGVDFPIASDAHKRRPCNVNDALVSGVSSVAIRYHHATKIVRIMVEGESLPTRVVESAPVAPSPAPEATPAVESPKVRKRPAKVASTPTATPVATATPAVEQATPVATPAVESADSVARQLALDLQASLAVVQKEMRKIRRRLYIPSKKRAAKDATSAPVASATPAATPVATPAITVEQYVAMSDAREEMRAKLREHGDVNGYQHAADVMSRECAKAWREMSTSDRAKVASVFRARKRKVA